MKERRIRLAASGALVASVSLFAAPAEGGGAPVRFTTLIAPGVTLTHMVQSAPPEHIKVLTVSPASSPVTLDVALAGRAYPAFRRTSEIARDHGAIAAVNGDFGLYPGYPTHAFAEDGDLVQTSLHGTQGKSFAVSLDEQHVYIGRPEVVVTVERESTAELWEVTRWNEPSRPPANELAGYTRVGGDVAPPPENACAARLSPSGGRAWAPGQLGIVRSYTVGKVVCGKKRLGSKGVVLAAGRGGEGAARIKALTTGETVRLTWTFGWPGITEAIGGNPMLVKDGKAIESTCASYVCRRHPRTGVGVTADGRVLLVVVDGRRPGWSVGMSMNEFAEEMLALGAVDAMNLDGGGSTTMWVKGRGVVNRPSDGEERPVSSALLVLPGVDPGEPPIA